MGMAWPALATSTYIGSSLGKECFEAVSLGTTSHGDLRVCDNAIQSGTLTSKDLSATYVNRGIILMRMEQYTKAVKDYERALDINPDLAEAKINMGAALIGLRRYASAIAYLEQGLASETFSAHVAYYNLGIAHERLGDYKGARGYYLSATDIVPEWPPALRKLESLPLRSSNGDAEKEAEASR
jgi:tetratricopeptide (TPR) repeat protein